MQDHVFQLKPSKFYLTFLIFLLMASTVVVLTLPAAIGLKSFILLWTWIYMGDIIWRFGLLKGRNAIVQIQSKRDGRWLIYKNKNGHTAVIAGNSTVTTKISILRFRIPNRFLPYSCIVLPDSLGKDEYRLLLFMMRFNDQPDEVCPGHRLRQK